MIIYQIIYYIIPTIYSILITIVINSTIYELISIGIFVCYTLMY